MSIPSDHPTGEIPWSVGARLVLEGDSADRSAPPSSLAEAVRRFWAADWERQSTATLLIEREIALDGQAPKAAFYGDEIDALARRLVR